MPPSPVTNTFRHLVQRLSSPGRAHDDKPLSTRYAARLSGLAWGVIRHAPLWVEVEGTCFRFWDPRGPDIYWPFFGAAVYEHSVVRHLRQISSGFEHPNFVDVGAHYGYYTVYMSKLAGGVGHVFAFEPNRSYLKVLSVNLQLNRLTNVHVNGVALSDRSERVTMEMSEFAKKSGWKNENRKIRPVEQTAASSDSIQATRFDDVTKGMGIKPDIVKIDVHGAEGKVVAGMKRSLETRIKHLYCELHPEMVGGFTPEDVVEMIKRSGMRVYEIVGFRTKTGRLVGLEENTLSKHSNWMIYARSD